MTKVQAEAEFKFRGKVNAELVEQYRYHAGWHGAERPKKDAATARRAATTLKRSLDMFSSLMPEQRLALSAASSVLSKLALDLDCISAWATQYKGHCDAERARLKAEAEDAIAEKLWAGDDSAMLADARELVDLFTTAGQELMGEFLKQSKTFDFDVIYLAALDDSRRLNSLRLAATAQPADLKTFRRDAAYCVDQLLARRSRTDKNYRGQRERDVGGKDYLASKAWRQEVKAAVAACAPSMNTSHTDDAQAGVPTDTEFWSQVAACQALEAAEDEAS